MIEWVNLTIVKFVMESIFMSIFFPRLIILKDDGMYRTQSFVTCKHALTAGNTLRQNIQSTQQTCKNRLRPSPNGAFQPTLSAPESQPPSQICPSPNAQNRQNYTSNYENVLIALLMY